MVRHFGWKSFFYFLKKDESKHLPLRKSCRVVAVKSATYYNFALYDEERGEISREGSVHYLGSGQKKILWCVHAENVQKW